MAAPLKRVCRQVSQSVPRWTPTPTPRTSTICSAQWPQQSRAIQTSSRCLAQQEIVENDLDNSLEALDENLPSEAELSSTAHAELDQHRELREMMRLAAWEMPFLSQHAKPYTRPEKKGTSPLRWRYTTYFSETHPASRKVVVEFNVHDLKLGKGETQKLRKLAGSRYNPQSQIVKMSCESFETIAQNKRCLADTVNKLIIEAKDLETDSFEDVPLDTRHHKFKKPMQFPEEWRMTEERRQELEAKRRQALLEEGKKVEQAQIVSGAEAIEADRQLKLKQIEEPIMEEARRPLPAGKQGKKQMGQKGR
ncbi:Putative ribosomal protein S24/S35 [Septoria linicola]|uniref:Ribosomal protein S24/S35 n=1 Tax=Septoria linicola TaxID=215465 RepID=A0A9Q9AS42_9PEZI|nr:putative ribosomal protein S24/S35 [Septoria linicola]USW53604.1 Putative ribosomal protein S24/S35 [Septoria linicola]